MNSPRTYFLLLAVASAQSIVVGTRSTDGKISFETVEDFQINQSRKIRLLPEQKEDVDALRQSERTMSLAIEGKRLFWRSLKTAAVYNPELQGTDYQALEWGADEQRLGVEPFRMGAAKGAFAPGK